MFTAIRINSNIEPQKFESLGNGFWYYNYDIQSEVVEVPESETETVEKTRYNFIQVRMYGKPTYERCIKAIIRQYIDQDQEFNLINTYNSYQLGVSNLDVQYEEYLQLVKTIKEKVGNDFLIQNSSSTNTSPKQSDLVKLMTMIINTVSLTDQQALSVKSLYPNWENFIGTIIQKDLKVKYQNKLFKVIQEHLVQEQYPPSIDTASLYTEIVEDHTGTLEDPIPYPSDGNMIIYNGKYYIENGIIYLCIRDSQQPLYAALSTVVNNYVQVVEQ